MDLDSLPEILIVEELASFLRISDYQARYLCNTGKIKATNVGGKKQKHWRISKSSLREFLDEQQKPAKVTVPKDAPKLSLVSFMGL